jgi:hypothetical protein
MARSHESLATTRFAPASLDALPSLERALAYEYDAIPYKFLEDYAVTIDDARELFHETKKWLWLVNAARRGDGTLVRSLAVTEELRIIDAMWHTFVLFTREYAEYCDEVFGRFIHHVPTTKFQKDRDDELIRSDPAAFRAQVNARKQAQYGFIYDQLGAETLKRWYLEYPRRFRSAVAKKSRARKGATRVVANLVRKELTTCPPARPGPITPS